MQKFFTPNLERKGRIVRAALGVGLLAAGVACLWWSLWASLALLGGAAFVLFEASRGWCALRACGIKTKL